MVLNGCYCEQYTGSAETICDILLWWEKNQYKNLGHCSKRRKSLTTNETFCFSDKQLHISFFYSAIFSQSWQKCTAVFISHVCGRITIIITVVLCYRQRYKTSHVCGTHFFFAAPFPRYSSLPLTPRSKYEFCLYFYNLNQFTFFFFFRPVLSLGL